MFAGEDDGFICGFTCWEAPGDTCKAQVQSALQPPGILEFRTEAELEIYVRIFKLLRLGPARENVWNGSKHAGQGGRQKERRWGSERKWQKPEAKQNDRKGAA